MSKTKIMLDYLLFRYGVYDLSVALRCTQDRMKDYIDHKNINFFEGATRNKRLVKVFANLAAEDRLEELGYSSSCQSDKE